MEKGQDLVENVIEEREEKYSARVIFDGLPFLRAYFRDIDGRIRSLRAQGDKEEEVKRLKKKRTGLYDTLRNMGGEELQFSIF